MLEFQKFNFAHSLVISILVHLLVFALFLIRSSNSSLIEFKIDSKPGAAQMRFSLPQIKKTTGIGESKTTDDQTKNESQESSIDVPAGVLTNEISKVAREIPYPPLARRMGMQGTAIYQIETNDEGKAVTVQLLQSTGYDLLDRTAASHLQSWQFSLKKKQFNIPVRFILE